MYKLKQLVRFEDDEYQNRDYIMASGENQQSPPHASESTSHPQNVTVTPITNAAESYRQLDVSNLSVNGSSTENVPQLNNASSEGGFVNHGYESPRRRISLSSEHVDIGPVRKKSILHNSSDNISQHSSYHGHLDDGKHVNGDPRTKKTSVTDSVYSKASKVTRFSEVEEDKSWWYSFCLKCRQKDSVPSWQPPGWQRFCPHPFCPSYRQFSRVIALILIGVLTWGVVYCIAGKSAAPGGLLFSLAFLSIAAHFGGWLMTLTTLPALIGMLIVGIIFQNLNVVDINDDFKPITGVLRKIALVIILTRAGLELDSGALRRLKFTVMKLGLTPWFLEAIIITITTHFLLDLPWSWGFLLGSIIAAVSPAVVVPCLFRLRGKGYGVAKGIPTLIIAVAGIDDAISVALFGIVSSVMFSDDSLAYQILQGPISIFGGIGFGIIWGWMAQYVPEKQDPFVVPLRVLMLLGGGLIAVFGSEQIGFEGAGPLGCIAAAFVSSLFWSRQGWEIDENPASTAFEIFWMIFEPILFGITGAAVKINELDPHVVSLGITCLIVGVVIRICITVLFGIGCKLNFKEKVFVALSWMAKATVQAALGPVALHSAKDEDKVFAEIVLMVSVLSIILTAPTGAILITLTGPRLLTKTKAPQIIPEGWRRSHRPSIRDISIIDEEEERDSPEKTINHIT